MADRSPRAVAEAAIAAWNRGEDPIELGLVAEDVEYVNPHDALEGGTRHGWEGWRHAMRGVNESFEIRGIDVHEVREAGDRAAVHVTFRIRGRTSGVDTEQEQGFVFTVRDGRTTRFEWWNTWAEAFDSVQP